MDLKAIFRIIRPVNLFIMALTLFLVRYCIFEPIFEQNGLEGLMPAWQFLFLVAATLLIAAGGYVINDVLDIGMDKVNKPDRMIIGNRISDVTGKNLHLNLTAAGVLFGLAFSWMSGNILLGIFFVIIPTALFYYSFKYKYLPAAGNLVVAILSAMVILIYWIFEFYHLKNQPGPFVEASRYFTLLNRFLLAYAAFAFMVSLMREIVKDAQDIEGDARFGCRTLPIVLGIPATRAILLVLEIITMAGLAWFQVLLNRTGYQAVAYALLPAQGLLVAAFAMTFRANDKPAFRRLSLFFKLIMLAGMLSLAATWLRNL